MFEAELHWTLLGGTGKSEEKITKTCFMKLRRDLTHREIPETALKRITSWFCSCVMRYSSVLPRGILISGFLYPFFFSHGGLTSSVFRISSNRQKKSALLNTIYCFIRKIQGFEEFCPQHCFWLAYELAGEME